MDNVSVISDTDHMLFTILSNPERVRRNDPISFQDEEERIVEEVPRLLEVPREEEARREVTFEFRGNSPHEPPPVDPPPPEPVSFVPPQLEDVPPRPPSPLREEVRPPPPPSPPREEARPPSFEASPPLDDEDSRRAVLLDLRQLEMSGAKLSKEWTMHDSTQDMMLELRRVTLSMDEASNVNMMKDGLKLALTGIEMVNARFGLLDLEGWSSEACKTLNKHDANLARIYRKYWKRGRSSSPEMEIAMSLIGSMGMHHVKRKMSKQLLSGRGGRGAAPFASPFSAFASKGNASGSARPPSPDSSDDEGVPP